MGTVTLFDQSMARNSLRIFPLVALIALAGAVDGALTLGFPAASRLAQGSILGYLPTSLVFAGGAIGASLGAILGIDAQRSRREVRPLPTMALTLVEALLIAVFLTWLLQHAVPAGFRLFVAIVGLLLVALSAVQSAFWFQVEAAAARRPTTTLIVRLACGALIALAAFLLWIAYLLGVAIATFS